MRANGSTYSSTPKWTLAKIFWIITIFHIKLLT